MHLDETPSPDPVANDPAAPGHGHSIEILHLSLPRTGTVSLQKALSVLGLRIYHGGGTTLKQPSHISSWKRAALAKFDGHGRQFTRADWDTMFTGFNGASNFPCVAFADELGEAYPHAKVILVQRDAKELDRFVLGPYRDLMIYVIDMFFRGPPLQQSRDELKARYTEHYEYIRRTTPPNQLLEYRMGSGWEPLCDFLDKSIPNEPFPVVNDRQSHGNRFNWTANVELGKWVGVVVAVPFLGWYLWTGGA